jgi:hypothetical protein
MSVIIRRRHRKSVALLVAQLLVIDTMIQLVVVITARVVAMLIRRIGKVDAHGQ